MENMINSPEQKSGRKLFYGLFIFPLLIAVGMAVLLCTVVLLTKENESPEALITSIKTGTPSKRWQKAFELSNEIHQGRALLRESGVMKEVIHILNERKEYDAKTRSYMAMALSKFDGPEVATELQKALQSEEDPSVQLYLIWALGAKKVTESAETVTPFLTNADPELRKVAAYVLGGFGDTKYAASLEPLLDDSSRDVRWNAALALAKLGSDRGYAEILKMLDRQVLEREGLAEDKAEEVMTNAVKGLGLLRKPESLELLARLSNSDKSLKVRQAAIDALAYQKSINKS